MIDENILNDLEAMAEAKISGEIKDPWFTINPTPAKELIRLARLGLWAEKHAIEAMEMGAFHHQACDSNWYDDTSVKENWDGKGEHRKAKPCTCAHYKIDLALAALPKEGE